jgi:hypothetical protein
VALGDLPGELVIPKLTGGFYGTINEVIDRWVAFNEKGKGKGQRQSGGAVHYDNQILWSYRTPIAKYAKDHVLVSSHSYSPSTNRHVRWAQARVNWPCYVVPYVGASGGMSPMTPEHPELHNLYYLEAKLTRESDDFTARYRQTWPGLDTHFTETFTTLYTDAKAYAVTIGLKSKLAPLDELIADAVATHNRKRAAFYDPAAVARRERDAARRLAKKALFPTQY